MKIKNFVLVILIFSAIAYSCKKQDKSTTSLVAEKEVKTWLESQKIKFKTSIGWIDEVSGSLNFKGLQKTILNDEFDLVTIPLKINFQHTVSPVFKIVANETKLLILLDKAGAISSGKIVTIESEQKFDEAYTNGLIKSMLNLDFKYKKEFTGNISILAIDKYFIVQNTYNKGTLSQRKLIQSRNQIASYEWDQVFSDDTKSSSESNSVSPKSRNFIDWYLIITNFVTYKVISITYQYTTKRSDSESNRLWQIYAPISDRDEDFNASKTGL